MINTQHSRSRIAERFFRYPVNVSASFGDLAVMADYQPEESDTNTQEGVELCSVVEEDFCILDTLNREQWREVEELTLAAYHEHVLGYGGEN